MNWYQIRDFIRTRNGQVLVFSVVLAGLFIVAARIHKARQKEVSEKISQLSQLTQNEFWEGDKSGDTFSKGKGVEIAEVNESSRLLRIPERKQKPEQVEEPNPIQEPMFVPRSSLILFQRSVVGGELPSEEISKAPSESSPPVVLTPGRILYCQLIAPVSSTQGKVPVIARLTKAYVVNGQVLLPLGTRITGQLQGVNGKRLSFSQQWLATLPSGRRINFSAQLQEAAYDTKTGSYLSNDGLAGLPGYETSQEQKKEQGSLAKAASTLVGVAGNLAKKRVETEIQNVVPASGRGVAASSSSELLGELLNGKKGDVGSSSQSHLVVSVGTPIYLFVTTSE